VPRELVAAGEQLRAQVGVAAAVADVPLAVETISSGLSPFS
jgi:hypothetical protein